MPLYKYVTAERIDVLQNGLIRFTQPNALNDPWDMRPHVERLFTDNDLEEHIAGPLRPQSDEQLVDYISQIVHEFVKTNGLSDKSLEDIRKLLSEANSEFPGELGELFEGAFAETVQRMKQVVPDLVGLLPEAMEFVASLAKCPTDPLSAEYRKCLMAACAPLPRSLSPEDERASSWMWNLPRSVEIRKRLAAIRATGTQSEVEERAYRDRIKARSGALQVPILVYKGKQDVFDWDADAPHATMQGALNFFDMVGAKNPASSW